MATVLYFDQADRRRKGTSSDSKHIKRNLLIQTHCFSDIYSLIPAYACACMQQDVVLDALVKRF